ncbi:hypothetical protein [Mesobacillus stamsii]|uniref:PTS ascorbate transporter subunit IIC n=1 Tax=Mesobacillus stamsii TaxID=225347 RepID=A0ABU0FSI8_9BACI|nr:hypothetical protein [Mesobacillus stamsii]MDQ0412897.1 hypothetical protein [Mesobacillus stamsii]
MFSIDFWTTTNMSLFWDYAKVLLETTAPGVMIWFALIGVGMLLTIVVGAWKESAKKDNDDDYDYKEY